MWDAARLGSPSIVIVTGGDVLSPGDADRERILRSVRRCRRAALALAPVGVVVVLLALALGDYAAAVVSTAAVVALIVVGVANGKIEDALR